MSRSTQTCPRCGKVLLDTLADWERAYRDVIDDAIAEGNRRTCQIVKHRMLDLYKRTADVVSNAPRQNRREATYPARGCSEGT